MRAAVLFQHGLGEHGDRYPYLVAQLVAGGYGVYACDARGHGRSTGRRGAVDSFDQLVDDLDAVVWSVIRPAQHMPLVAMGYSLGGAAALTYALDHQDTLAGAISIGCAVGPGAGVARWASFGIAPFCKIVPRMPILRVNAEDMTNDPQVARRYTQDPLVYHGRYSARTLQEILIQGRCLHTEIQRLRIPLLLIHGGGDLTADVQGSYRLATASGATDTTLKIYPGRRHDVLNDIGHEQAVADILHWLNEHT
nr:alpha/beta hydrolase [Mycolicibacterium sp. CH28]